MIVKVELPIPFNGNDLSSRLRQKSNDTVGPFRFHPV